MIAPKFEETLIKPVRRGFSFYVATGENGGLRWEFKKDFCLRIVLWRVAFAFVKLDVDYSMGILPDLMKDHRTLNNFKKEYNTLVDFCIAPEDK